MDEVWFGVERCRQSNWQSQVCLQGRVNCGCVACTNTYIVS